MHRICIGIAGALLLTTGAAAAQEKTAPQDGAPPEKTEWACPPGVLNPGCADQALGAPIRVDPPPGAASGASASPGEGRESRDIGAPDAAKDVGTPGDREPPAFTKGQGADGGSTKGSTKE